MGKSLLNIRIEAILLVVICVALYFLGKLIPQETIKNFVATAGVFGPIAFIVSYIPTVIVAPINGLPFMITGFYLFGKITLLYILIASMVGFTVNFLLAKRWGKPIVRKIAGVSALEKIEKAEAKYTVWTLIIMRLLLSSVGDFISYGFGLTPMSLQVYFIVTTLFSIPSFIVRYFLISNSDGVEKFLLVSLIVTVGAAAIFLVAKFVDNKILKQRTL
ncbi:MAG TPA: VTT domain-containing protein [Candidatus Saccharimonadales bacterium]|nr:VTT domain-containing protein [Candidatus Saccharimonadales bacterium]